MRFNIDGQYHAIKLSTTNLTDFIYLVKEIYGAEALLFIINWITSSFADKINTAKDADFLNFLYKRLPDFVIDRLNKYVTKEKFLEHLNVLELRDEISDFVDSSSAVIKLFRSIGDDKFLYNAFFNYPIAIKHILYNFDGSSIFQGQEVSHKMIFAIICLILCRKNHFQGFTMEDDKGKSTIHTFKIGEGYEVYNNLDPDHDHYSDKYTLTQQHIIEDVQEFHGEHGTKWNETVKNMRDIEDAGYYYPLQPVYFIDMTAEDKFPILVPAIYVKTIAHEEKVADLMKLIRVLGDLLALILGIFSLGTGDALIMLLSLGDIGISAKDLQVVSEQDELMKTPEGRKYLENWNRFALIGGILTGGILLIRSTFQLGAKLLSRVVVTETKNFLQGSLKELLIKTGISGFLPESIHVMEVSEVAALSKLKIPQAQAQRLFDAGVFFVKGDTQIGEKTVEEIAVVYENKVVAKGDATILGKQSKKFESWTEVDVQIISKGQRVTLQEFRWEVVNYVKRSDSLREGLREIFNKTVKKDFILELAKNPENIDRLRKAGVLEEGIAQFKAGKAPDGGWRVHHKFPLDDGGTNDFSNLILIKEDPFHMAVTGYQQSICRSLAEGEVLLIKWPVIDGNIYP